MTIAEEEGKEPASRRRGRRICPMCELEYRKNEWPSLTEAERVANPNYCALWFGLSSKDVEENTGMEILL
eukprot:7480445-Prorocentrum_lima.AAC.1